jgi:MFS family permease
MRQPVSSNQPAAPPPPVDAQRSLLHRAAGAFAHRDFRLVWFAALGSTIGTWMQKFAQRWLVLDLTDSNFYLGLDDFISQLPILLFMLIGGVIADRYDRRRLLTWSQYVQAFSAFSLAALVFWDWITIWHVLSLSFLSGCAQAFGGPAYQSMIPSLVPRRELPNAIALNSTQFNLSRVLGPMGGTVILISLGMAGCFFLNGLSFFLVVIALAMIKPLTRPPGPARRSIWAELRSGLDYVLGERLMLTLTVLVTISTFLAMPMLTLLPTFARNVLSGEGGTPEARLAYLMASQGLGAIAGALIVGALGRFRHMGLALLGLQVLMGLLLAAFALSATLWISCVLIFISGIAFMGLFSISFSIVQLAVPEELRGRVVSIYMVALRGGGPLGALASGALADVWSAPATLIANGLLLSVVTVGILASGKGRSLRAL